MSLKNARLPAKVIVGFAIILFAFMAVTSQESKTPVRDEPVHWRFGYQLITQGADANPNRGVSPVSVLNALPGFLTGETLDDPMTRRMSRIPSIFLGMLLVLFVGRFAWSLYGPWAGAFASMIAAFEPNLIAHGSLVTVDMALTLFMLLAIHAMYRFSKKPNTGRMVWSGIALGLALAVKATALVFVILIPFFIFLSHLKDKSRPVEAQKKLLFWGYSLAVIVLIAVVVINISYGFTGSFRASSEYHFHSSAGQRTAALIPSWMPVPFPSLFVQGIDLAFWAGEAGHPGSAFLMGEFNETGFPHYYLVAFGIKSTIGFLVLLALTLWLSLFKRNRSGLDEWFIWTPVILVFAYFSLLSEINIGLRYILPVYPFLCIAFGRLMAHPQKRQVLGVVVTIALVTHIGGSVFVWPHYLEFFNGLVGGPDQGYKYLNDSNLSWGQNLGLLREYAGKQNRLLIVNPGGPTNGLVAINANRYYLENFEWLRDYEPIDRVAHTWFVYYIDDLPDANRVTAKTQGYEGGQRIDFQLIGPSFDTDVTNQDEILRPYNRYDVESISVKGSPHEGPANVLIITVDTLRSDHLHCYGHFPATSPVMDALSRRSALFTTTYCQFPRTTPSHATIFTGLLPAQHGSTMNVQPIKTGIVTLAEILSGEGYQTGAVVASAVISARASNLDRGFEFYEDATFSSVNATPTPYRAGGSRVEIDESERPELRQSETIRFAPGMGEMHDQLTPYDRPGNEVTDIALKWLRNLKNKPFFLWLHYFDPHSPYSPPHPYGPMFSHYYSSKGTPVDVLGMQRRGVPFDLNDYNMFHGLYDGEIRFADYQMGRVFRYLERIGYLENTIIVLTSDHGESLGEYRGYVGHGEYLNEGSMKIPMIVTIPGMTTSRIIDEPVQTLDVFDTVLDILNVQHNVDTSGISLKPLLANEHCISPERPVFMQSAMGSREGADRVVLRFGMLQGQYKYVAQIEIEQKEHREGRVIVTDEILRDFSLYDIENDPNEQFNLLETRPDLVTAFRKRMLENVSKFSDPIRDGHELSEEDMKILKALGYVQ
jgi:arylsulfatase A-like enzyme/4-amino-4-deoxy-L-arabinose transferase-like glycosyltransferase